MQRLFLTAVLLSAAVAHGGEVRKSVVGQVVAVPDAAHVWVYLPDRQASYPIALEGVDLTGIPASLAASAQATLSQRVLERSVRVAFDALHEEAPTPGVLTVGGQAINNDIAKLLHPAAPAAPIAPPATLARDIPPRRPLAVLCSALRILTPWRRAN